MPASHPSPCLSSATFPSCVAGATLLKAADERVDAAVSGAQRAYAANAAYLQEQLARQKEFHAQNLTTYREAREAYLKKVRAGVCEGQGRAQACRSGRAAARIGLCGPDTAPPFPRREPSNPLPALPPVDVQVEDAVESLRQKGLAGSARAAADAVLERVGEAKAAVMATPGAVLHKVGRRCGWGEGVRGACDCGCCAVCGQRGRVGRGEAGRGGAVRWRRAPQGGGGAGLGACNPAC